jgi:hypothetical protein
VRAWLDQWPVGRRGTIANWFHYAVRTGAQTPAAVLLAVRQGCQRRLQWGDHHDTAQVLEALDTDARGALAYASSVISYEQLPLDARRKVKAKRAFAYLKQALIGKPATEAQARYLRSLGYTGELPTDRGQASALIDMLQRGRG